MRLLYRVRPVTILVLVLAALWGLSPLSAAAGDELFVVNSPLNLANGSVTVYSRTASGNTAPLRTLKGAATGLNDPASLALDPTHNELFVANAEPDTITVYSLTASGDIAPLRTLSGAATGLGSPAGLALDLIRDELFVANAFNDSITVYSRTASGDTAPLRTISGAATGLSIGNEIPVGLALDPTHDELFVTNFPAGSVTVYSRTADGNIAPLRTIDGAATFLYPTGLALDVVNDELFVVTPGYDKVSVYSRTASGATAPLRILSGGATELRGPQNPFLDLTNDELFVPNLSTNSVTVYSRTASGETAPLRKLQGLATGLSFPINLAIGASATGTGLTALSPANVWVGTGAINPGNNLNFDLRAEVSVDGTPVGSGELDGVPAAPPGGFNYATLDSIPLTLLAPASAGSGSILSLTVAVRISCSVASDFSGIARLWFSNASANSAFDATIGGVNRNYFLLSGFALGTAPGPGPRDAVGVSVSKGAACPGRPFKPIGTWSITLP